MQDDPFEHLKFVYSETLRAEWKSGKLSKRWRTEYPQLFTDQDFRLVGSGESYLFFEWLAAILLFHATGYLAVHKWDCENHEAKIATFRRLADPDFVEEVLEWSAGYPDLLLHGSDDSKWFFCEVKGHRDRIGPKQLKAAHHILKRTGRRVILLHLAPL